MPAFYIVEGCLELGIASYLPFGSSHPRGTAALKGHPVSRPALPAVGQGRAETMLLSTSYVSLLAPVKA